MTIFKKYALLIIVFMIVFSSSLLAQNDTIPHSDFTIKKTILPSFLIVSGLLMSSASIKNKQIEFRNKNLPNFHTSVDDYLQFLPHTIYLTGSLMNLKAKHSFKDRVKILAMGSIMMVSLTTLLKKTTNVYRPNGLNNNSFPSGHTVNAFFGATLLDIEYQESENWYNYCNYLIASSVGVLRMANNKHWASDVLVGAGIGIFSAKFTNYLYPKVKSLLAKEESNLIVFPNYSNNGLSVQMYYTF